MTNMATIIKKSGFALAIAFSLVAMAFGVCMLGGVFGVGLLGGGQQAHAAETLLSPFDVTDDTTRIEVSKLAKDDHTFVAGAQMAIIEKETGKVIAQWTTASDKSEMIQGSTDVKLNVNTYYILREVKAPAGFDKVPDVIFTIPESEELGITIMDPAPGTKQDYVEQSGSYSVSLYDERLPVEKVVTQRNTSVVAPKTGDETPYGLCAGIAIACLAGIVVLQVVKTRKKDGSNA